MQKIRFKKFESEDELGFNKIKAFPRMTTSGTQKVGIYQEKIFAKEVSDKNLHP